MDTMVVIGLFFTTILIACAVYWLIPLNKAGTIDFPHITIPDINVPKLPDINVPKINVPQINVPNLSGSEPNVSDDSATTGQAPDESPNSPEAQPTLASSGSSACRKIVSGACPMTCQSSAECPSGLACIEGRCQCSSPLGGRCLRPSDCDCRVGIRCDIPAQKCVPSNFYTDINDAYENCPAGVRRGYYYDPFVLDERRAVTGGYQEGFRCL